MTVVGAQCYIVVLGDRGLDWRGGCKGWNWRGYRRDLDWMPCCIVVVEEVHIAVAGKVVHIAVAGEVVHIAAVEE